MTKRFKTGLKPRTFDPRVPHYSVYAAFRNARTAAPTCDNYVGMSLDTDILGNNTWGNCAEAATYREVEILTFTATGTEVRADTKLAETLYSEDTGFDPNAGPSGNNPTDNGTNLQQLLNYRINTGVPLPNGSRTKLIAYFELDPRNLNDCRLAVEEGGVIQLGINCYNYFQDVMQGGEWLPPKSSDQVDGEHAICSGRYDAGGFIIKSWAMDIYMPIATFEAVVTEAYCVVSPEWVKATGQTPLGMSLVELDTAMSALRY